MITNDPIVQAEKNCLVSDLINGFPPELDRNGKKFDEGTWMNVWTSEGSSGTLVNLFKMVFGHWKKLK